MRPLLGKFACQNEKKVRTLVPPIIKVLRMIIYMLILFFFYFSLFALHEKYNDIVSSYMTQSNTMAAPWFEYFWRKMDFIRLDLSGCMKE